MFECYATVQSSKSPQSHKVKWSSGKFDQFIDDNNDSNHNDDAAVDQAK